MQLASLCMAPDFRSSEYRGMALDEQHWCVRRGMGQLRGVLAQQMPGGHVPARA